MEKVILNSNNILFITLSRFTIPLERGIYTDLVREMLNNGINVFVICPNERRYEEDTILIEEGNLKILRIRTLNIQKTNFIEKGIAFLFIDFKFKIALKKYFKLTFNLILYSTPPINITKSVNFIKKRDKAISYLLLKDIFPQNAVDLKLLSKYNPLYLNYRKVEKKLYSISDHIGCMSKGNIQYLVNNNKLDSSKLEVNPNSISLKNLNSNSRPSKKKLREKYSIPEDSLVLLYGGNLGIPQGIDFLIQVIESNLNNNKVYFVVAGDGTKFNMINDWYSETKPANFILFKTLTKDTYDELLELSDVGLIFLDKRFTIPNIPSRLLSYLEKAMPVIAATDENTDLRNIIEEAQCGYWVKSGNLNKINFYINELFNKEKLDKLGKNSRQLVEKEYQIEKTYNLIINKINNGKK